MDDELPRRPLEPTFPMPLLDGVRSADGRLVAAFSQRSQRGEALRVQEIAVWDTVTRRAIVHVTQAAIAEPAAAASAASMRRSGVIAIDLTRDGHSLTIHFADGASVTHAVPDPTTVKPSRQELFAAVLAAAWELFPLQRPSLDVALRPVILWPDDPGCPRCTSPESPFRPCDACLGLYARRAYLKKHGERIPAPEMAIAEAVRALEAHRGDEGRALAALLRARIARIAGANAECVLCGAAPAPSEDDVLGVGGRACAACVTRVLDEERQRYDEVISESQRRVDELPDAPSAGWLTRTLNRLRGRTT